MISLPPLESCYDASEGREIPLPEELAALYGALRFPVYPDGPTVIGNFVSTLDGVVALGEPGCEGGRPISGSDRHDRMVMGLLRAAADAVIVGAGTLRSLPHSVWTPEHASTEFAGAYRQVREALGAAPLPLNVFVTASGEISPDQDVFHSQAVPVLIVTTTRGRQRVRERGMPEAIPVAAADGGRVSARAILNAVSQAGPQRTGILLVEGGPHLMGDFLGERLLDELFLTLAPQVAGRDAPVERPGFVAGRTFVPADPLWGSLTSVKRGASFLFLRYSFRSGRAS